MIRRTIKLDDNSSAWLLIPQPTHARIAYELACSWGCSPVTTPQFAEILLPTLLCHDDGWHDWERKPDVESRSGKPYSFTEMIPEDAQRIWEASIRACRKLGPLAQYLVASHFIFLCGRGDSAATSGAIQFSREYGRRADDWLAAWQKESPATNTTEAAHTVLSYLQMFDFLSLWFCCTEQNEPYQCKTPDGCRLEFKRTPEGHIHVQPWPWHVSQVNLRLTARLVPARRYQDGNELAGVESHERNLTWIMVK